MPTIGTTEAAKRLGITARRIVALINAGRLKARLVSGVWLIDERSLATVEVRKPGRPQAKRGKPAGQ